MVFRQIRASMRASLEEECIQEQKGPLSTSALRSKMASLEEECIREIIAPDSNWSSAGGGLSSAKGRRPSSAKRKRRSSVAGFFSRTVSEKLNNPSDEEEHDRVMRRFAPKFERPVTEQIESLFAHERNCYEDIKAGWEDVEYFDETSGKWVSLERECEFSEEMYLRFARFCGFNPETALGYMELVNPRYLGLTCNQLEEQLLTQTLFVLPGLQTNDGLDVFYMRPSRYFPKEVPTSVVIDNLIYVMQVMQEKEKSCTEGIAFMANMAGWTRENFCVSYCFEFMKALQGRILPVHVKLFLIVDPPSWFGVIWKIMLQMLSMDFAKRVRIVSSANLDKYLQPGYQEHLPDEMAGGKSKTIGIVSDFVAYRKIVEARKAEEKMAKPTSTSSFNSSQSCRF